MYVENGWIKDDERRTLICRGVNLSGSSKVPSEPDGATYRMSGFFDHRDVSFVGRPFPLIEADEHFQRLETWGMNLVRLVVTWEAIEHKGPGKYDDEYLDYLEALIEKGSEYGIQFIIDPHQDVWSRWTGGDGAPGWTLEAVGMDPTKIHQTGAAIVHSQYEGVLPKMIWPTNYTRFAAATMFTLFFGGNTFAPRTRINGIPVQEFLQGRYLAAFKTVAQRLKRYPNVVGFGCMNEPHPGFIGWHDLNTVTSWELKIGPTPTPFQSMVACSGMPQRVAEYSFGLFGPKRERDVTINPEGLCLWKPGYDGVWRKNGVWTLENFTPQLRYPHFFAQAGGKKVEFNRDFLKPFLKRFYRTINAIMPSTCIFIEGVPGERPPRWYPFDGGRVVYSPHWYDTIPLITKRYVSWLGYDHLAGKMVFGRKKVQESINKQLAQYKHYSTQLLGGAPVLISEFGIPFDINKKRGYRRGDFSAHAGALRSYYNAMDQELLSCTIWNYTPDNRHRYGDHWNEEDLSIFSRDEQKRGENIHSGGRAIGGFCRPYAHKIAGKPISMEFRAASKEFFFRYEPDVTIDEPSELFIPHYHYPDGYEVNISAGSFKRDTPNQRLLLYHSYQEDVHSVIVSPARRARG
jgi:hypothetical protein